MGNHDAHQTESAEEKLLNNGYEGTVYLTNFSYDDALIGVSYGAQVQGSTALRWVL